MPDQNVSLYRVRGLVSGANWRATKFATPVPPHLTCGLCRVISHTTFLLPCFHTLCESCVSLSGNDGSAVCPFDEKSFAVDDCPKFPLPPDSVEILQACCWNEPQGCTFVGTLQAVLTHYEQHCTFHAVSCPRCSASVLRQDLPRHYRAGCQGDGTTNSTDQPTLHQGLMLSPQDIATSLDELKALIREPYQDRLPELQSNINEFLEEARSIGTQMETVAKALTDSEVRLAHASEEQARTFGVKVQSLEAKLRDNQSDSVARALRESEHRLSEQLAQSRQELSKTFVQEFRSELRELSTHLTKSSDLMADDSREELTATVSEMPWKLEKRHILRKLELVATESHAYLELLRYRVDEQLKQPMAEVDSLFSHSHGSVAVGMSPFISRLEAVENGYVVRVTNVDSIIQSKKVVLLFTRWYRRDKYLQVAADGNYTGCLSVYLKWGGTVQGSCSASGPVDVYLRHPEYPRKKDRPMQDSFIWNRADVLGFQTVFLLGINSLHQDRYLNGDCLTLVVSFKK
ncbi:uncharacterized protein LOC144172897 [Haemaphysalis longicornis]